MSALMCRLGRLAGTGGQALHSGEQQVGGHQGVGLTAAPAPCHLIKGNLQCRCTVRLLLMLRRLTCEGTRQLSNDMCTNVLSCDHNR